MDADTILKAVGEFIGATDAASVSVGLTSAASPVAGGVVAFLGLARCVMGLIGALTPAPSGLGEEVFAYTRRTDHQVSEQARKFFKEYDSFSAIYKKVRAIVDDAAKSLMVRNGGLAGVFGAGALPDLNGVTDIHIMDAATSVDWTDPIQIGAGIVVLLFSPQAGATKKVLGSKSSMQWLEATKREYDAAALAFVELDVAIALHGAGKTKLDSAAFEKLRRRLRDQTKEWLLSQQRSGVLPSADAPRADNLAS